MSHDAARDATEQPVVHVVPATFGADGGVVGGAERYALELAKAMARRLPTRLVTFGPARRRHRDGDLEIEILGPSWRVRGQAQNPMSLRLFRALAPARVIHCHQQHVVATSAAALYARLTGRRVFVSDLGGGGWDVSSYLSTDRWFHGHLHLSAYSRRIFGHEGKPWAHVVGGGVDVEKFSPDAETQRDGGALFVGRLLPHKGVDDLIRALPDAMDLTVIGPAPDERYRRDLVRLAAGRAVQFRHDVDDAGLVHAYRRARCIVLPSVYRTMYGASTNVPELLGQTLLEGMACGAAAVATDVASLPEVVASGQTGFIVPPNNPARMGERLAWLRDHPAEAEAMGHAGRRRVLERFTWPSVVTRCLAVYDA